MDVTPQRDEIVFIDGLSGASRRGIVLGGGAAGGKKENSEIGEARVERRPACARFMAAGTPRTETAPLVLSQALGARAAAVARRMMRNAAILAGRADVTKPPTILVTTY